MMTVIKNSEKEREKISSKVSKVHEKYDDDDEKLILKKIAWLLSINTPPSII